MSVSLKVFLIFFTIIYLLLIFKLIKKRELNLSFSIFWIFAGLALIFIFIAMLLFPGLLSNISKFIGFEIPANMVFCISIFALFYIGLDLTWRLSKENRKNILLIQEVSMLKDRLEKLENKINSK